MKPMTFAAPARHKSMTTDTRNFLYVDCDIPDGVTLSTWRAQRSPARRRHGLRINRLFA
jgi:hypothetical protein